MVDAVALAKEGRSGRALASVVEVGDVRAVAASDFLSVAMVGGWAVVVRTGEVAAGARAVYLEIDALVPHAEWVPEAVRARFAAGERFRIKTIKLRGELSQGLLVPLDAPGLPADVVAADVGTDVTDLLDVTKYEAPDPASRGAGGGDGRERALFPVHLVPKTDQPRIQSNVWLLPKVVGKEYVASLKYDGTSATYILDVDGDRDADADAPELLVCSRNCLLTVDDWDDPAAVASNAYIHIAATLDLRAKLVALWRHHGIFAVQGEICGPHIATNIHAFKERTFHVFDMWRRRRQTNTNDNADTNADADADIDAARPRLHQRGAPERLWYADMVAACASVGLVPVMQLHAGAAFPDQSVADIVASAEGKIPGTKNDREGIVFRFANGLSFKAVSNRFLLKKG